MGQRGEIHRGRHRESIDQFEFLKDSLSVSMTNVRLRGITRVVRQKLQWRAEMELRERREEEMRREHPLWHMNACQAPSSCCLLQPRQYW